MSETISSQGLFSTWSDRTWLRLAWPAGGLSGLSFIAGAKLLLTSPGNILNGTAINGGVLVLACIATLSGGAAIYSFNRYATLHADVQFIAQWTNLLCRVLAIVELLSFAAVLAWLILHVIGVPPIRHFHHFHY